MDSWRLAYSENPHQTKNDIIFVGLHRRKEDHVWMGFSTPINNRVTNA